MTLAIHTSGTVFQMLVSFLHEDEVCQRAAKVTVAIKTENLNCDNLSQLALKAKVLSQEQ